MDTEKERKENIKKVFLEYARKNELSALNTTSYYARQFLPEESFFLKREVINDLINSGIMVPENGKYIIKNMGK